MQIRDAVLSSLARPTAWHKRKKWLRALFARFTSGKRRKGDCCDGPKLKISHRFERWRRAGERLSAKAGRDKNAVKSSARSRADMQKYTDTNTTS